MIEPGCFMPPAGGFLNLSKDLKLRPVIYARVGNSKFPSDRF